MIFKFSEYIKEAADHIVLDTGEYATLTDPNAIPFLYYKGKLYTGSRGDSHEHLMEYMAEEIFDVELPKIWHSTYNRGRIFTAKDHKIVAFWLYPPKSQFDKIILDLEKDLKIKIFDNGYRVLIEKNKYSSYGWQYDHPDYEKFEVEEMKFDDNHFQKLIPVEWYSGKRNKDDAKRKPWWYRQMLYGENKNNNTDMKYLKLFEEYNKNWIFNIIKDYKYRADQAHKQSKINQEGSIYLELFNKIYQYLKTNNITTYNNDLQNLLKIAKQISELGNLRDAIGLYNNLVKLFNDLESKLKNEEPSKTTPATPATPATSKEKAMSKIWKNMTKEDVNDFDEELEKYERKYKSVNPETYNKLLTIRNSFDNHENPEYTYDNWHDLLVAVFKK